MKKFLAIILAILMIVASVPYALANEGDTKYLYLKISDGNLSMAMTPDLYVKDNAGNEIKYEYEYYIGDDTYSYNIPADIELIYWDYHAGGGVVDDGLPFFELPDGADAYNYDENRWYCLHQNGASLVEDEEAYKCEICGEKFRVIYVDWNFGWHAGNFQKMFFDSMGNKLPYEFESIEDNFDLYRISVDAASYWFDFSNNGIHEGTIPEKVDYYEAATKTWSCSHNMETSGEQTCKGFLCGICGEFYGEPDTNAHDWSNLDGICANGCGAECDHAGQTGVCTICGKNNAVAMLTLEGAQPEYFSTMKEAIDEARKSENEGALVTVLQDIEFGGYSANDFAYIEGGSFTIDLNGKKLNSPALVFSLYKSEIDFIDSVGTAVVDGGEGYAIDAYNANANIYGGTYKGFCGIGAEDGTVIIDGANVKIENYNNWDYSGSAAIKASDNGTVTVKNAVISTTAEQTILCYDGSVINIEGGTISGSIYYVGGDVCLSGGTFLDGFAVDGGRINELFEFVKDGYAFYNSDGEVVSSSVKALSKACTVKEHTHSFTDSSCPCGVECLHESFVEGKCDDCGIDCPHKNFVDDKCSDCGAEGKAVTITMTDSWGDGWNGNAIAIEKLIDGVYTEVARATFEDGDTATYNAFLDKDGSYVFKWIQGSYSNECSFVINVGGEDVYEVTSASGLTNGQEFYRICEHKTFTDGKCDCGYECPHAGQTGTCTICGKIIHTHNYEYTASGNTITATCTASGTCDAPDGSYLKLVVPTKYSWKQYSATAKEIEVENTIADISYEVDYCCDGGCINAGSHTASVTLGGATATVGFEIEKYYVSQASLIMSTRTKVYDGTTDAPGEINALKFYMATGSEIINLPADGYQATVRYETPEVGDRKVIWQWVKVTDQEAMKNHRFGYNDFENGLNSDFSITKRPITVTPEANEVLIGNQPNAGNKVIVGGDYGLADNQTITVTYQHIDSSAVGEKELIIDTVTILDANGNDVTSNYEITTVNGICDVVECPHETYTDGKCDCGYECPHEDITEYGWDYCYTCGYIVAEEIALDTPHTVTERHFVKFTPEVSGRYHFWSYDTTDGADPEGCVYEGSIFNYLDFIGSNNNFLYGNPAYNEITFEAELIAGKTYYFELFEYRKTQNGEPFEYTVMIKKICDNGAHNFTDSICDVCGYECFHPVATEGVCDNCGSACTHNKQNKEITVRPVQNDDGTWEKGTVEITCQVCGNTETKEVERDHEGYKTFDETAAKLEALINSDELIDSPKNGFTASLNNLKNSAYSQVYTEIEGAIPSMTDGLNSIIATIEAGLANGTMKKADWTFMTAILDEIKALIDNDPNKIIPSMVGYYYGPNGFYSGSFGNPNYPQADYDRVMTEYGFKNQLETLLAGLKDGTALKADYTEIDEAIAEIEQKLADENVTDEAKAGLEEIKSQLEEMKQNPISSAADLAALEKALEEYETELDAGIEDGSAVEADYTAIDEAIEELDEKLSDVNLTEEAKAGLEEIKAQLEEMKKDPSASKADVDEFIGELEEYEEELDKAIEDGSAVEVDGLKEIEDFVEPVEQEIKEKYGEEEYHAILNSMSDEADAERYSIIREARSLTGSLKDNADKLEELKARLQAIFDEVINCLDGIHNGLDYVVIEEAKCEANAIESATCTLCGEEVTREVEGSALKHSFTKYEVTQETTCTNAGIKLAYCDNGCGETDEKAIAALEHIFLDYIYNEDATCEEDGTKTAECVFGCGTTETVTDEGTKLGHIDEDGDKICDECESEIKDVCPDCGGPVHEGEYGQYICALRILIKLLVSLIQLLATMA